MIFDSPTLKKFLSIARLKDYQLPGNPEDEHIIGCSGGADSTVLLILMKCLFPDVPFRFVFTDTQAEPRTVYEMLKKIEDVMDIEIEHVTQQDGLYGLIESFGNFLPNHRSRYCTRILKTEAIEDFLESLHEGKNCDFHQYVGLRADEPGRVGLNSEFPWLINHMPFRDLGMVREDIFNILSETVGIPAFYKSKSRSGCTICPFQRQSELIGSLQDEPADFKKAESVEKLCEEDAKRFAIKDGNDWSSARFTFPIPPDIDLRTAHLPRKAPVKGKVKRDENIHDLFGEEMANVYVGIEYFVDPMMPEFTGFSSPGVWHQEIIGFSTSKGGMSRKLSMHYQTKLSVAEVHNLTQAQMREQYRQAIFLLEIPVHLVDVGKSSGDSFGWKQGQPMAQLRQVLNWVKRTLHVADIEQQLVEYADAPEDSWRGEQREGLQTQRDAVDYEVGTVLSMERFIPTEKEQDMNEHEVPCFVCSK